MPKFFRIPCVIVLVGSSNEKIDERTISFGARKSNYKRAYSEKYQTIYYYKQNKRTNSNNNYISDWWKSVQENKIKFGLRKQTNSVKV